MSADLMANEDNASVRRTLFYLWLLRALIGLNKTLTLELM